MMERTSAWQQANQRHVIAAVLVIRRLLEARLASPAERERAAEALEQARHEAEAALLQPASPSALESLSSAFGLSPFEQDVLLLCAGMEFDAAFSHLCAAAQGDPALTYPTFSLALAALPAAHWSALTPEAPLRHWMLVELEPGPGLTRSALRINERVLHYLAGVPSREKRLVGAVHPPAVEAALTARQQGVVERCMAFWLDAAGRRQQPVIQLNGPDADARVAAAAATCRQLGMSLAEISAAAIPVETAELETWARLLEREAILEGTIPYLNCDQPEPGEAQLLAADRLASQLDIPLFISSRGRRNLTKRGLAAFDIPAPDKQEQRLLWELSLGEAARSFNGQLDSILAQFELGGTAIAAASRQALAGEDASGTGEDASGLPARRVERLWQACRSYARPRLEELAQRLEPAAGWYELVLPEAQLQTLENICAQVRQRLKVYETWGFAARSPRGLGISALFSGESGTGKTLAAEVLAHELKLDLFRIDLSSVVSKYIGETEKNLRQVFDAAEAGGAILLFDEADALFGKRSEVKDSHDRYANIEVSYLLQRMEAYRGLAILTTNLKSALDGAFLRRIRFIVHFPFPDQAQRFEIWKRIFPAQTPLAGLNLAKLARLNVTGGNIRNIALNAAFLAADESQPVGMNHVRRAAQAEYAKLEKSLTEGEIGGW